MKKTIALSVIWMLTTATTVLSQEAGGQDAGPRDTAQARQGRPDWFQQVFTLPGVEFTPAQQTKIKQLREKYAPQLIEIHSKHGRIFTEAQRKAHREAFQTARAAGKRGGELREAIDAAVQLTDGQKEKLATIQKQRAEVFAKIQRELRDLLTDEQRRRLRPRSRIGGPVQPPTHRDVKYGPHGRNVMDVWLAESDKPTPVLVSIHGGGFLGGNKSVSGELLRQCLEAGISVVAITYRLSGEAIAPAQFLDSARAIQFIRHKANAWNLDPTRIAATGGSAGAGISLWLGFHGDLADPDNKDPVLRESTRLTCMSVYNGQTSYDPRFIRELFPDTKVYTDPALAQLYDVDLSKLDDLPDEKYKLFEQVSSINHLTKDDAPALLCYASKMDTPITSQGIGIHHPRFGKVLKEKMDQLGMECHVHAGVARGTEQWVKLTMDFVKKHFGLELESGDLPADTGPPAASQTSMKGWELYIWQQDSKTYFSLLVGTNRIKTKDEITRAAVQGIDAIKPKLDPLKPGQYVFLRGRRLTDSAPADPAKVVAEHCRKLGLKVQP